MVLAEDLAKQQRSISVAEFFEKNKHLLGFDSPTRGIITTIKEAVDNALDACEEAEVLPDIFVGVKRIDAEVYRITVEDNGPGIVPEKSPWSSGSSSTGRGSTRSGRAGGSRASGYRRRCCMRSSPPAPRRWSPHGRGQRRGPTGSN
jgi:DNA topoisomerase VI, subunit B